MLNRRFSPLLWVFTLALAVVPLLLPAPFGALAAGGHTHSFTANPSYSAPYPYVSATQVVTSAEVGIYGSMGSGMMDMDECTGSIDPYHGVTCGFGGSYGYQRMAYNSLFVVGWTASRTGGKFGWMANGQFVEKGPSNSWTQVTHYKAPPTAGPVTLTVTVEDDPHATDPETNTVVTTATDGQKSGSITITVTTDPSRPTWYPDAAITGASISAPSAGATAQAGQPVTCTAGTATDADKKEPSQMYMYGMGQTEYPADTVSYKWTATGGTFANANAQNTTWSHSSYGTYTLTLTVDDQNDANKPAGDNGTRDDSPVTFTRTVTVSAPTPTWSTYTAISGGISTPTGNLTVALGASVPFEALAVSDSDQRTANGTTTTHADSCSYSWSATGGSFSSTSALSTTWTAPNSAGTYTVTFQADDANDTNKPAGEAGSRNDNALVVTRTIQVFNATWTVDSAITGAQITSPSVGTTAPRGGLITCTAASGAADVDQRTPTGGSPTTVADVVQYSWSASGGSFQGGVTTGLNATWVAPNQSGSYTITLRVDDQNDANKPAGEGGTRNDAVAEKTVTVSVLAPSWSPDTTIQSAGISQPATSMVTVDPGQQVTCATSAATDRDRFTNEQNVPTYYDDVCNYQWSATGGSVQNATSTTATWTAPQDAGTYTVNLTVNDVATMSPPGEGSRDDSPRTFSFTVKVRHYHQWTTPTPIVPQGFTVAEQYPLVGETVQLTRTGTGSDADTCIRTDCSFPGGQATNATYASAWVASAGTYGYYNGATWVNSTDPALITHWKAPTYGGVVTLTLKTDDTPSATDPATGAPVTTADDTPGETSKTVRVVTHRHSWTAGDPVTAPVPTVSSRFVLPGESVQIQAGNGTDSDQCTVSGCCFSQGKAPNATRLVSWTCSAGRLGYLTGSTFTESSDPLLITHWEAPQPQPPYYYYGTQTVTITANIDDIPRAFDTERQAEVDTFDDPTASNSVTVKVVRHRHVWEQVNNITGGGIYIQPEEPYAGEYVTLSSNSGMMGGDYDHCTASSCSFYSGNAPNTTRVIGWMATTANGAGAGEFGYFTGNGQWTPSTDPAVITHWKAPASAPPAGLSVTLTTVFNDIPEAYDSELQETVPTYDDEPGQSTRTVLVRGHAHTWDQTHNLPSPQLTVTPGETGTESLVELHLTVGDDHDHCWDYYRCPFSGNATNRVVAVAWDDGSSGGQFGYLDGGVFMTTADMSQVTHYRCPTTAPPNDTLTIQVTVDDVWEDVTEPGTGNVVDTFDDEWKQATCQLTVHNQHTHQWDGVQNLMSGALNVQKTTVTWGERITVDVGESCDGDHCVKPNCSFLDGDALNAVEVDSWTAPKGTFGYYNAAGAWVPSTDAELITHWEAPRESGVVTLSEKSEDVPSADDPVSGQPVATFDDNSVTETIDITVVPPPHTHTFGDPQDPRISTPSITLSESVARPHQLLTVTVQYPTVETDFCLNENGACPWPNHSTPDTVLIAAFTGDGGELGTLGQNGSFQPLQIGQIPTHFKCGPNPVQASAMIVVDDLAQKTDPETGAPLALYNDADQSSTARVNIVQHFHDWEPLNDIHAAPPSLARDYVNAGEYLKVNPGVMSDADICKAPSCPFPGGIATNAVRATQWKAAPNAGGFGFFDGSGQWVPSTDGALISHWKAPTTAGEYELSYVANDTPSATEPESGASVSTYDDAAATSSTKKVRVRGAHVHNWDAVHNIQANAFTVSDTRVDPGARIAVSAGSASDLDHCSVANCPFQDGYAFNTVKVVEWKSPWNTGGTGNVGTFGYYDALGAWVPTTDPALITHWEAPVSPGVVKLIERVDDVPLEWDPATETDVATFDDNATETDLEITVNPHVHDWVPVNTITAPLIDAQSTCAVGNTILLTKTLTGEQDYCRAPGCPFPDGTADNEVKVTGWTDSGRGGQFGFLDSGNFVVVGSTNPQDWPRVDRYRAPMSAGAVTLRLTVDDQWQGIAEPGTTPPTTTDTYNDSPAEGKRVLTVTGAHAHDWDATRNVEPRYLLSAPQITEPAMDKVARRQIIPVKALTADELDLCIQTGCPFPGGEATNQTRVKKWEDDNQNDGDFGYFTPSSDPNLPPEFVVGPPTDPVTGQPDWTKVTHYRCPASASSVTIKVTVADIWEDVAEPGTGLEIDTYNDDDRIATKSLTLTDYTLEVMSVDGLGGVQQMFPQVLVSSPTPTFEMQVASFAVTGATSELDIRGALTLRGKVHSRACDLTPGTNAGVISEIKVFLDHNEDPYVTLNTGSGYTYTKETYSSQRLARPYPFEGSIDAPIAFSQLEAGSHVIRLEAFEKSYGMTGVYEFAFELEGPQPADEDAPSTSFTVTRQQIMVADTTEEVYPVVVRVNAPWGSLSSGATVGADDQVRQVVEYRGAYYVGDESGTHPDVGIILPDWQEVGEAPSGETGGGGGAPAALARRALGQAGSGTRASANGAWYDTPLFFAGEVAGFAEGGFQMVTGTIDGLVKVAQFAWSIPGQVMKVYNFFKTEQSRKMLIEGAQVVSSTIKAVLDVLRSVLQSEAAIIEDIQVGNWAQDRLKGLTSMFRQGLKLALNFFVEWVDQQWNQFLDLTISDPFKAGQASGKVLFEVFAILQPYAKAGKLANLKCFQFMKELANYDKLKTWLSKFATTAGGAARRFVDFVIGALARVRDSFLTRFGKLPTMCFVAGTPIYTASGMRPIETIRAGDMVLSRDPESGRQHYQPVLQTFVTRPEALYHIRYRVSQAREVRSRSAGQQAAAAEGSDDPDPDPAADAEIVGTGEHPFWVVNRNDFVPAAELKPGDRLRLATGGEARVVSMSRESAPRGERFTTYNFEVAEYHTYFAGTESVWVHNHGLNCDVFFSITRLYKRLLARWGIVDDWEVFQYALQKINSKHGGTLGLPAPFVQMLKDRFAANMGNLASKGVGIGHSPRSYRYSDWENNATNGIAKLKSAGLQGHHWWPEELGGAHADGLVVAFCNPFLHTRRPNGVHPLMRDFFKRHFGKSTWKANKADFLKLSFPQQKALLQEFYWDYFQLATPDFVLPGKI